MLKYKNDVTIDANEGRGRVTFKCSQIVSDGNVSAPNIAQLTRRLDELMPNVVQQVTRVLDARIAEAANAVASSGAPIVIAEPSAVPAGPVEVPADLLAKIDMLEAQIASLEERLSAALQDNSKFTSLGRRMDEFEARVSQALKKTEEIRVPPLAVPVAPTAAPSDSAAAPAADDASSPEEKKVTTPDGRVIVLRRVGNPPAREVKYAW